MSCIAHLLSPTPVEPRPIYSNFSNSALLPNLLHSYTLPYPAPKQQQRQQRQFSIEAERRPAMTKDGAVFVKGKAKGEINFPPYQNYDEESLRLVQAFGVWPLGGAITDYARRIPYNSEKKTFLGLTGRDSFEVFQYIFRLAGDDKEYCVMWDYNIGLVRITPFFKGLKYSKTTPAKMLGATPGLKEITHSITGGALAAQGYWMPYACARAVCVNFCAPIAGALIPLFGPDFPSLCVPRTSKMYGRWNIDPSIVIKSTIEANEFREFYSAQPISSTIRQRVLQSATQREHESISPRTMPQDSSLISSSSPARFQEQVGHDPVHTGRHYGQDDQSPSTVSSGPNSAAHSPRTPDEHYMHSPTTAFGSSYTSSFMAHPSAPLRNPWDSTPSPISRVYKEAELAHHCRVVLPALSTMRSTGHAGTSPWLSAVPRSHVTLLMPGEGLHLPPLRSPFMDWRTSTTSTTSASSTFANAGSIPAVLPYDNDSHGKRRADDAELDGEVDGNTSDSSPSISPKTSIVAYQEQRRLHKARQVNMTNSTVEAQCEADKDAAMLLMGLSVHTRQFPAPTLPPISTVTTTHAGQDGRWDGVTSTGDAQTDEALARVYWGRGIHGGNYTGAAVSSTRLGAVLASGSDMSSRCAAQGASEHRGKRRRPLSL